MREFRIFVAVYEERSFSAAAKRENATQSAVSQRIRKLEEVLAVRLFNRTSQRVEPTPAGTVYYEYCVQLLDKYNEANVALQRFRGVEGIVNVGIPPWMSRHVVPNILSRFMDEHPNVVVNVIDGNSTLLCEMVSRGELSLAVIAAADLREEDKTLAVAEGVLVSRGPGMPWNTARLPRDPAELASIRLIMPKRGQPYRTVVDAFLETHGVRPKQVLELDSVFGTLGLVAKGDWHTILPAFVLAADPDQEEYTIQTLTEPPHFRLSCVTSTNGDTAACRSFMRMLEGELSRITLNTLPLSRPLVSV
ncbi:LysR family transcriptional regulator [Acuticoccus sp. I52.16.1]|uniref:LysR family transcriptional regulator n=1 Tax=Acuticoccus sp. I52.16.1 TaxID=2928472 RepID=UPI001FD15555|nr:LysR family transcriptional regulator [Acuticoccus sp. I52.16.1]UOM35691.1 LysR family transcriptional regulator [Acuticoccus sp. I52.16.1]